MRCDDVIDCENGADEFGCYCTSLEFRCSNGTCIAPYLKCNGQNDCPNGEDEREPECPCGSVWRILSETLFSASTPTACLQNEFACNNGQCVHRQYLCDDIPDCSDRSDEDENYCAGVCAYTEYECESGQCIEASQRCNNIRDCSDGSDEKGCDNSEDYSNITISMTPAGAITRDRAVERFHCTYTSTIPVRPEIREIYVSVYCTSPGPCAPEELPSEMSSTLKILWTSGSVDRAVRLAANLYAVSCVLIDNNGRTLARTDTQLQSVDSIHMRQRPVRQQIGQMQQPGRLFGRFRRSELHHDRNPTDHQSDESGDRRKISYIKWKGGTCYATEFACASGNQCIPRGMLCDKTRDCHDNSDEIGCNTGAYSCEAINGKIKFANPDANVVVRNCNGPSEPVCPAGSFNDLAQSRADCIQCFCFGKTPDCSSARLEVKKTYTTGARCDQCKQGSFFLSSRNQYGCTKCFCMGTTQECTSSNLYRDSTSKVVHHSQIVETVQFLIFGFQANRITLYHYSKQNVEPEQEVTINVPLLEEFWQKEFGQKADREDVLQALADVSGFYIKATYTTSTTRAA
ncbi:unnamed protein product [Nesidiocoris tenuis]|uniref:Laminin IV type A domain-containing protein n=1 Tax=Nesidiocoris tenuis TaxID=355587 RepID=A0A6H5HVY8_9HEMI|nr:unnamed protein product [Nesidiocoris tenuis]